MAATAPARVTSASAPVAAPAAQAPPLTRYTVLNGAAKILDRFLLPPLIRLSLRYLEDPLNLMFIAKETHGPAPEGGTWVNLTVEQIANNSDPLAVLDEAEREKGKMIVSSELSGQLRKGTITAHRFYQSICGHEVYPLRRHAAHGVVFDSKPCAHGCYHVGLDFDTLLRVAVKRGALDVLFSTLIIHTRFGHYYGNGRISDWNGLLNYSLDQPRWAERFDTTEVLLSVSYNRGGSYVPRFFETFDHVGKGCQRMHNLCMRYADGGECIKVAYLLIHPFFKMLFRDKNQIFGDQKDLWIDQVALVLHPEADNPKAVAIAQRANAISLATEGFTHVVQMNANGSYPVIPRDDYVPLVAPLSEAELAEAALMKAYFAKYYGSSPHANANAAAAAAAAAAPAPMSSPAGVAARAKALGKQ